MRARLIVREVRGQDASQVPLAENDDMVQEAGEESHQAEQESDHRTEIVAGSQPADQPLARRARFWRRTAERLTRTERVLFVR